MWYLELWTIFRVCLCRVAAWFNNGNMVFLSMKNYLSAIPLVSLCAASAFAVQNSEMLHPVCMEQLVSGPESSQGDTQPEIHDLTECQKINQSLPFEKLTDFHARFTLPENSKDRDLPYFVEYRIIGSLKNQQTLVQIASNYGGTMTLSNGMIITDKNHGKQRRVEVHQQIPGGDRCLGGIEKLAITAPDTVEIQRRITTDELLRLNTGREEPVDGVADCAICCNGIVTEQMKTGGALEFQWVQLNRTLSATEFSKHQQCFNELIGNLSEQAPLVMHTGELKALQNDFNQKCLSEEKPR